MHGRVNLKWLHRAYGWQSRLIIPSRSGTSESCAPRCGPTTQGDTTTLFAIAFPWPRKPRPLLAGWLLVPSFAWSSRRRFTGSLLGRVAPATDHDRAGAPLWQVPRQRGRTPEARRRPLRHAGLVPWRPRQMRMPYCDSCRQEGEDHNWRVPPCFVCAGRLGCTNCRRNRELRRLRGACLISQNLPVYLFEVCTLALPAQTVQSPYWPAPV